VEQGGGDPEIRTAVLTILRTAVDSIMLESNKYSDPSEREYRAGMQQAAHMVRRLADDFKSATELKKATQ
jgi:hypothetical protein